MINFPDIGALIERADHLRVLLAPMNFADQPMALVRALRRAGHYARHVQYTASGEHALGYGLDGVVKLRTSDVAAQLQVVEECLEHDFEIFHFWQRSLVFTKYLDGLTGFDLPIIKAHARSIFHRFTGFDLRMPTLDRQLNKYSPYNYGYVSPFDESRQLRYIEFLGEYVDRFFVQDPEMAQFLPQAEVLPRGLALEEWQPVGIKRSERPLIVHAPSNPEVKGSNYVVNALEELKHEGLNFDFKLLVRVPHAEAKAWYRKADVIIDQIMIGATGVLTLEAWALAKPCVTYLREDLFNRFYDTSELPVANANPDNIKKVLKQLIVDYEWRAHLAAGGREIVEKYHDMKVIGRKYVEICEQERRGKTRRAASGSDLLFFREGMMMAAAQPAGNRSATLSSVLDKIQVSAARLDRQSILIGAGVARRSPYAARIVSTFLWLQIRLFEMAMKAQLAILRRAAHLVKRLRQESRPTTGPGD